MDYLLCVMMGIFIGMLVVAFWICLKGEEMDKQAYNMGAFDLFHKRKHYWGDEWDEVVR